ncbi:MAG: hypothetical protein ABW068_10100 [Candidatus Thiodiazotropha sp.]
MNAPSPGASFDNRPIRARVTAVRQTVISAEVNGSIRQLSVAEGNTFKRGQASLRSHERFWDIQVHQNRFDL